MILDRHELESTPPWHSSGETTTDSPSLDPGRGIGWYHLESVLGEGTFGRVYLAQHEVLGRRVAIKVLNRRHGSGRQEIRAFLNEALILAEFNHPGIVPVFDAGWTEDGLYYIVSRYVEGGDLRGVLCEAGSPPGQPPRSRSRSRRRGLRPCSRPGPPRYQAG